MSCNDERLRRTLRLQLAKTETRTVSRMLCWTWLLSHLRRETIKVRVHTSTFLWALNHGRCDTYRCKTLTQHNYRIMSCAKAKLRIAETVGAYPSSAKMVRETSIVCHILRNAKSVFHASKIGGPSCEPEVAILRTVFPRRTLCEKKIIL